jgi:thioester reductase-like protein
VGTGEQYQAGADGALLLTGATGFLGMELLARWLERTERPVYALVRARDDGEARRRLLAAARAVVPNAERHAQRLIAVRGDVAQPGLGLSDVQRDALAERVMEIVHAAASVEFSLPLAQARAINVAGTRRLLAFAERCAERGGLRRFGHVSTAYVAGTHRGTFAEDDLLCGQNFRNPYERTKWEAERLVRRAARRLPIQIFRPSIVVGEATSGWTPAFNVIYGPLKAYATGAALPVMPGRRSAPVDVVPVDYVADAIFELTSRADGAGATYSLAAGPHASSVGELVELSAGAFERPQPLTLPPELYRRTLHPLLLRRASGRRRRWLERSEVYFPYFALDVRYDTSRARAALEPAGIAPPPLAGYFDRLVGFAQLARWGRRPLSRVDAVRALQRGRRPALAGASGSARRRAVARPAERVSVS